MVPRLQARAVTVTEAQQARGLRVSGSLASRARAVLPLGGPGVVGALIDVRERTLALEARGFGAGGPRTAYRVVADPPGDRWLRLLVVLAIGAVVAWPFLAPGPGVP